MSSFLKIYNIFSNFFLHYLKYFNTELYEKIKKIPISNFDCWMHAVSLGEAKQLVLLAEKLNKYYKIVASYGTDTGEKYIKENANLFIDDFNYKFDIEEKTRALFNIGNLKKIITIENEVWPNMVVLAEKANIPIIIANARMTEKAFKRYRIFKKISEMLFSYPVVLAKDEESAEKFEKLGAKNVKIIGNLKLALLKEFLRLQKEKKKDIFLLFSTHEGEEEKLLELLKNKEIKIIICPRHPHRGKKIYENLDIDKKFYIDNLEKLNKFDFDNDFKVLVIALTGVAKKLFSISKWVYIGGFFTGGHNFLEPAAAGCITITGSNVYNFFDLKKLVLNKMPTLINFVDRLEEIGEFDKLKYPDANDLTYLNKLVNIDEQYIEEILLIN